MGKTVKISPIKKSPNGSTVMTMETGLAAKGLTRVPGTGVFKFPYKDASGRYRTGLDENAAYIKRLEERDPAEAEVERQRIKGWKQQIMDAFDVTEKELANNSTFWNYTKFVEGYDEKHATPVKLLDQDNYFDLDQPRQLLAFLWLRVHPTIASSFQAYERGEFGPDCQFYVADDEVDNAVLFKKKQVINKAIAELLSMTPTKMKRVARMMGLPVGEDSKEEVVYNAIDSAIKDTEMKTGTHKGVNPVNLFNRFAHMDEMLLEINDLIEQAITHSIYRIKQGGRLYEGEIKIATDKAEWVAHLADEDNQEDLIALKDKLKAKKMAAVS